MYNGDSVGLSGVNLGKYLGKYGFRKSELGSTDNDLSILNIISDWNGTYGLNTELVYGQSLNL